MVPLLPNVQLSGKKSEFLSGSYPWHANSSRFGPKKEPRSRWTIYSLGFEFFESEFAGTKRRLFFFWQGLQANKENVFWSRAITDL